MIAHFDDQCSVCSMSFIYTDGRWIWTWTKILNIVHNLRCSSPFCGCIYDNAEVDALKIISDIWHKGKHVTSEKTLSGPKIIFLCFCEMLKFKSQKLSMQIKLSCMCIVFISAPSFYLLISIPLFLFTGVLSFINIDFEEFGCCFFSFFFRLFYPPHLQIGCSEIMADSHSPAGASQPVVVKTQKIKQDKLKVHLKDKEESWIIETPTLIRTVKRARRWHHIGQSLCSSCAVQHTISTKALGILTHNSGFPISASGLFKVQRRNNVDSLCATYAVLIK